MTEEDAREFVRQRCDADAFETTEHFIALLQEEAQRQNLVASASLNVVWARHIADSAQLLDHCAVHRAATLVDFGSGAGLPGIVLAIMRPNWDVVLIESRRLRIDWLQKSTRELGLKNVRILGGVAEKVAAVPADVITARAFAPMKRLLALAAPFSTSETLWLLPKGRSAEQELAELPAVMRTMFHVEQSATEPSAGIVIGRGKVET